MTLGLTDLARAEAVRYNRDLQITWLGSDM